MIDILTAREHRYPIHVGKGNFGGFSGLNLGPLTTARAFAVVDENVWKHHSGLLQRVIEGHFGEVSWMRIPSGESSKSLAMLGKVLDFLLEGRIRRNTPVMVIGGGVVGDLGGFAAASALRGVPFVQVPTTLLAMVDSSVGGKTGINHAAGKNLIGAFYQPEGVVVDLDFLATLPRREWVSGLGEVIKYGAIHDPAMIDDVGRLLASNMAPDAEAWVPVVERCVQIKADIVAADEMESGVRSWLNFGHTFAHAIEAAMGFQGILHGEAVYMGMVAAAHLSNLRGASLPVEELLRFLPHFDLKWPDRCLEFGLLLNLMGSDKKNTSTDITFVLLDAWGKPRKETVTDQALVLKALEMAVDDINHS